MNPLTQFKKNRILPLLIGSALIVAALTPMPALATPQCHVRSDNLLDPVPAGMFLNGSLNLMCRDLPAWLLITRVYGDSDLYITKHTFQAGGYTGWHTHPGPSLITVIQGALTVYEANDPTCTGITYTAGQSFTDIGCGDVHLVRNETNAVAIDVAVQMVPHGVPRRIEAEAPATCPPLPQCLNASPSE